MPIIILISAKIFISVNSKSRTKSDKKYKNRKIPVSPMRERTKSIPKRLLSKNRRSSRT